MFGPQLVFTGMLDESNQDDRKSKLKACDIVTCILHVYSIMLWQDVMPFGEDMSFVGKTSKRTIEIITFGKHKWYTQLNMKLVIFVGVIYGM